MLKTEALELLGGTVTAASKAIGISPAAVSQWPDTLSDQVRDRVQAALFRKAIEGVVANEMRGVLIEQRDRAAERVSENPVDRLSCLVLKNRNEALDDLDPSIANTAQAATENVAIQSV